MRVPPRLGSAEQEVLLRLTAANAPGTWSSRDGTPLYEGRALTALVCERLAVRGYLDETRDNGRSTYTVTAAGRTEAAKLRKKRGSSWSGFYTPTGG